MQLIPNWKRCLRMYSVQAMTAASAIQGAWIALPHEMKSSIPEVWVQAITMTVLALGILGRVVLQPKIEKRDENTESNN